MPVLRADYFLMQSYRAVPGEKVSCPVMAVYGAEDTEVNDDTIRDWNNYTASGVTEKMLSGGHFCVTGDNLESILSDAEKFII